MSIILRCTACGAKNKVRDERSKAPLCGNCGVPILLHLKTNPVPLDDFSFDNFLRKAKRPVLVSFWANWCAPCRTLAPVLESFARSQHSITIARLDTDRNPLTPSIYQVFSIPTLILFIDGKEVTRVQGTLSLNALEAHLKPWIPVN